MKLKNNFFSGLGLGLLVGFVLFGTSDLWSKTTSNSVISTTTETSDAVKGEWINSEQASNLESAYGTYVQNNNLPSNTTIGGFIGKKYLRDVVGLIGDGYIKYRFYETKNAANESQIGIIFYPEQNSSQMLRNGSASFCPVICEYPD
jgi:hypothetical protein